MSEIVPREAQFTGSVVGQCLGDALGFPLEGMPPGTCRRYVEQELRPRTGRPRARSGFQPGQYTDDSQLARELLISFVERERFDPADYASRIANQFASGAVVGPGRATEAAARRLVAGLSSLPRRLLGDHLHGDLGWGRRGHHGSHGGSDQRSAPGARGRSPGVGRTGAGSGIVGVRAPRRAGRSCAWTERAGLTASAGQIGSGTMPPALPEYRPVDWSRAGEGQSAHRLPDLPAACGASGRRTHRPQRRGRTR